MESYLPYIHSQHASSALVNRRNANMCSHYHKQHNVFESIQRFDYGTWVDSTYYAIRRTFWVRSFTWYRIVWYRIFILTHDNNVECRDHLMIIEICILPGSNYSTYSLSLYLVRTHSAFVCLACTSSVVDFILLWHDYFRSLNLRLSVHHFPHITSLSHASFLFWRNWQ